MPPFGVPFVTLAPFRLGAGPPPLDGIAQHDISCYWEVDMNEFESRMRRVLDPLGNGLSKLWAKAMAALHDFRDSDAGKRAGTRATSAVHDLRDSGASKRAATALHDLRDSDAGKRAATALHDLRESDAGKRAANALNELLQSEPVRKAETTAKRAMHDLRSGGGGSDSSTSGTTA
jgi:hypothetical protein